MHAFRHQIRWPVIAALVLLPAATTLAHPLGNDTITRFCILWMLPDRVEFDMIFDYAETPSMGFPAQIDVNKDGEESTQEQRTWLLEKMRAISPSVQVAVDGKRLVVTNQLESRDPNTGQVQPSIPGLIKSSGVAGAPTYQIMIRFSAKYPGPLGPGTHTLFFKDGSYSGYPGLCRVLLEQVPGAEYIAPHPVILDEAGSAFIYDQYDPSNLPQEHDTTFQFRLVERPAPVSASQDSTGLIHPPTSQATTTNTAETVASKTEGRGVQSGLPYPIFDPRNDRSRASTASKQAQHLIGLLQGRWGFMMFLTVTALAFGWGALHALMPGHAKTVVAAYLISQRGNYWHAVALAIIVTITHTALVVVVGVVIWLYQKTHPTLGPSLQLWLGVVAGFLVAGMGLTLVWRALTGRIAHHHHDHDHEHTHDHEHRSWFRKLFTHSHPHLPAESSVSAGAGHPPAHTHHHGHSHDHSHDPGHTHSHARGNEHDHGHAHVHPAAHDHPHEHAHPHAHEHAHDHGHSHSHGPEHGHSHGHGHPHVHTPPEAERSKSPGTPALTLRMLLLLGITGGIVPCPTATIIMLLGISANVVTGALYAVGMFSLGLALTLMLIGFAALFSRRFAARVLADARHEGELSSAGQRLLLQAVPAMSGLVVTLLGVAIALNYVHYLSRGTSLIPWLG